MGFDGGAATCRDPNAECSVQSVAQHPTAFNQVDK